MSIQTTFTFEEHDKLNRKPFADFLLSLIQHRNEYRRPDSNASYAIAIDAAYGSGKTRFLRMFQSMVKEEGHYNVAYYSAWEHDLYDDALAPILSLLDRPAGVFEDQAYERMEKTLGSKALRILKRAGISFLSMQAKKHFEGYEGIIDDIKALFNDESSIPDAYDLRMKCIKELQKGLQKATEDEPLIFIIDELDRCNPAFAIKTLEVAKHLLDVDNVIFIFALDMHQMRAAVRKFYGQDIDADGYLCKVFDYMTLLPAAAVDDYITEYLTGLDPYLLREHKDFCSHAIELFQINICSLRMIDTIFTAYQVMWHTFLREYESDKAYFLYLYALFLKFQHPQMFQQIIRNTSLSPEERRHMSKLSGNSEEIYSVLTASTQTIDSSDKYFKSGKTQYHFTSLVACKNSQIVLRIDGFNRRYDMGPDDTVNGILFYKDLMRYEDIKHLTYGQFIHRQLEMYNPIRTEEPATNSPST